MTSSEKFVVYWCGFEKDPPEIQSLPSGIDVVNLFLVSVAGTVTDTTLSHGYIQKGGFTWEQILSQAKAAQANGVKVCATIMPPNNELIYNNIEDPDLFATNVNNLINEWGLDGIDIDPEQGGNPVCNDKFIAVVNALSKYFGPTSGTGKIFSFVSYQYNLDGPLLKACAAHFDYVTLMGYFWSYDQMLSEFDTYTGAVAGDKLMYGVKPGMTSQDTADKLANWEPKSGQKGGMMEFQINSDTNYAMANSIIKILSSKAS